MYNIEIVIAEAACDRVNGGGASAVHIDISTERKHPGRRWVTHVTAMSENNKRKPEEVFSELAPSCRKSKLHCTRTHHTAAGACRASAAERRSSSALSSLRFSSRCGLCSGCGPAVASDGGGIQDKLATE